MKTNFSVEIYKNKRISDHVVIKLYDDKANFLATNDSIEIFLPLETAESIAFHIETIIKDINLTKQKTS